MQPLSNTWNCKKNSAQKDQGQPCMRGEPQPTAAGDFPALINIYMFLSVFVPTTTTTRLSCTPARRRPPGRWTRRPTSMANAEPQEEKIEKCKNVLDKMYKFVQWNGKRCTKDRRTTIDKTIDVPTSSFAHARKIKACKKIYNLQKKKIYMYLIRKDIEDFNG